MLVRDWLSRFRPGPWLSSKTVPPSPGLTGSILPSSDPISPPFTPLKLTDESPFIWTTQVVSNLDTSNEVMRSGCSSFKLSPTSRLSKME